MSSPESNFDVVVNGSSDEQTRKQAIDDLEAANECEVLADLARNGDLATEYRERALTSLAHPQCKPMLETLAEGSELPDSQRERARELLRETPDDAGAGP